jgi:4'-phosphopantetheinyl transferase
MNAAGPPETSDSESWAPHSGELVLDAAEIHVWRVPLSEEEQRLARYASVLAPEERARANRFLAQRDHNRYVVTRGILRELLGRYLHRSPAEIRFEYNPEGKPFLAKDLSHTAIEFNVSHAHEVALLAFAIGRKVGVDVERVRPDFAVSEVADQYFSCGEIAELHALSGELSTRAFFQLWACREAYVKALGDGLQHPLNRFQVSLLPEGSPQLLSTDASRWTLHLVFPDQQHAAAVVAEGRDHALRLWRWSH